MQEDDHLSNDLVYFNRLLLWSPFLEKQVNPADDFRRSRDVLNDSRRSFASFSYVGLVARKPTYTSIGVCRCCANGLFHFVRQRGGQLAHRGHTADVCEIRLRLGSALAFGRVCDRPNKLDAARPIAQGMSHHTDISDGMIRHQQATLMVEFLAALQRMLDDLLHQVRIIRMNSLENKF